MANASYASQLLAQDWLQRLEPEVLQALKAAWETVELAQDAILLREGDPGDALYILQEGALAVTRKNTAGTQLVLEEHRTPGQVIGEIALITNLPRNATIHALQPSTLWRLTKDTFDALSVRHPALRQAFSAWLAPRLQRGQLVGILNDIFGPLEVDAFMAIQSQLEWLSLASGDLLFREGDPGDAMYFVVSGRLKVITRLPDGTEKFVGEVGSGEIVGEFALLTGENRNATVYAVRDSNLARLTTAVFKQLLAQYPQAVMQIMQIIIKRSQAMTRSAAFATTNRALSFVLVPADAVEAALMHQIAQKLHKILSHFGATLYLDSQQFDERYGKAGAAQTTLDDVTSLTFTEWLNRQEQNYQYIVYQIDAAWTTWTRRCLRFADRILLVGRSGSQPQPTELEKQIAQYVPQARLELLLVHKDRTERPRGTAVWLQARNVHTHHHVRLGNEKDWQRLGRRLVGKAIGLVCSGGGVRSYNQLGAIRALEKAGIPIDIVGGVSMGSLVAGALAVGMTDAQRYETFRPFSKRGQLLDWTLPLVSLIASKKVTALLKEQADGADVADTWLPFFAVSTNTTKARPVIHQTGPLWLALRASISVPFVFLPVAHEGDLLVDGGLMNNLPIDVMKEQMEAGFIIAVNNINFGESWQHYDFAPGLSGWEVLWRRLNPFREAIAVPNLLGHHVRCLSVNFAYHSQSIVDQADILISPDLGRFNLFDFSALDDVIQVGYETTRERLRTWREAGGQLPKGALFEETHA